MVLAITARSWGLFKAIFGKLPPRQSFSRVIIPPQTLKSSPFNVDALGILGILGRPRRYCPWS